MCFFLGGVADLVSKQGWGFPQVLSKDARVDQLPLIDGNLTITIKFTIFAPNPTTTQDGSMMQIRKMESGTVGASKSIYNLVRDYNKMFQQANQNQSEESKGFSDVKIFSKDGQVVKAHRAILSGSFKRHLNFNFNHLKIELNKVSILFFFF